MGVSILGNNIFTYTMSNNTMTITEDDGVVAISISSQTGIGYVTGSGTISGKTATLTVIPEGSTLTLASTSGKPIEQLTIVAGVGVTVGIVANH